MHSSLKYTAFNSFDNKCTEGLFLLFNLVSILIFQKLENVVGWYNGFGFFCVEDPKEGNLTSFYEYATSGEEMDDPIPKPQDLGGLHLF